MKYIDLHTHSNASDGTLSPAQLVRHAAQCHLAAVALTDHDTVAGTDEALAAARTSTEPVLVIPGTELSVAYRDRDIHIVGLCINHHNTALQKEMEQIIRRRTQRNLEMAERLRKAGIPITLEDLTRDNPDTVVTRAHFARFLVEHQIAATPNEAFRKYLDTSTPYYVPRKYIEPEEGIELIRQAGGIPVLAHPLHYKLAGSELERLLKRLVGAGLMGIEVMYSSHTGQDEQYAKTLANKFHLLYSGGSDFHGSNKPAIEIGIGRGNLRIPYSWLEKLAASVNYPLLQSENPSSV